MEELGRTMSAEEFGLWCAFHALEPWGEARADLRAGIIAATVANYAGKSRRANAPAAKPADFLPPANGHDETAEQEPDVRGHFLGKRAP